MADAKKCDRCGNFFEYGLDNSPGIKGRKVRGVALLDNVSRRLKYIDLCPECTLNLCKWLGVSYDMWGGEKKDDAGQNVTGNDESKDSSREDSEESRED